MNSQKQYEQLKAGGCLVLLGGFLLIVFFHLFSGGSASKAPIARSAAYETGYSVGQDVAAAHQRPMTAGILQNVSRMRFPNRDQDQVDFRMGYLTGYDEPPVPTPTVHAPTPAPPAPTPSTEQTRRSVDAEFSRARKQTGEGLPVVEAGPETDRWMKLANAAAQVAEQWKEHALALRAGMSDLANLPPEPYVTPPADAPTGAETARRLFDYHDARGKAWRAMAQTLEARGLPNTPGQSPVYAPAAYATPAYSGPRPNIVSSYTRKDGTHVQSYRRR